jgi:uncharacterized membrane-anchored protein YitT (DUF2179 family)
LFLSALNVEGISSCCAEVVPFPVLYSIMWAAIIGGYYVASGCAGRIRMGRGVGGKFTEIRRHV